MALLKDTTTIHGIHLPNAHWRVNAIHGNAKQISFDAIAFVDATQLQPVASQTHYFVPDLNGGNFVAQAYAYLKTLPEFEGAVDC